MALPDHRTLALDLLSIDGEHQQVPLGLERVGIVARGVHHSPLTVGKGGHFAAKHAVIIVGTNRVTGQNRGAVEAV